MSLVKEITQEEALDNLAKRFAINFRNNYLNPAKPDVSAAFFEKEHAHEVLKKSDINQFIKEEANRIDKAKQVKKEQRKLRKKNLDTGPSWYGMKAPILTDDLKTEVKLIKLQHVMDKNYKYRKEDEKIPKHFEIGTVIDTHDDYYNRQSRKEKNTSTADIMLQRAREMKGKPFKGLNKKEGNRRLAVMRAIASKKRVQKASKVKHRK